MNAWEKPGLTPEEMAAAAVDHAPLTLAAIKRRVASAIRAAVEQERKACAHVAVEIANQIARGESPKVEQFRGRPGHSQAGHAALGVAEEITDLIRARSEVK